MTFLPITLGASAGASKREIQAQSSVQGDRGAGECAGFAICYWEMKPRRTPNETVDNIILPDGCIDLLANVNEMVVVFFGMKKTEFHYPVPTELPPLASVCVRALSAN
jgi:hypothetical protein